MGRTLRSQNLFQYQGKNVLKINTAQKFNGETFEEVFNQLIRNIWHGESCFMR